MFAGICGGIQIQRCSYYKFLQKEAALLKTEHGRRNILLLMKARQLCLLWKRKKEKTIQNNILHFELNQNPSTCRCDCFCPSEVTHTHTAQSRLSVPTGPFLKSKKCICSAFSCPRGSDEREEKNKGKLIRRGTKVTGSSFLWAGRDVFTGFKAQQWLDTAAVSHGRWVQYLLYGVHMLLLLVKHKFVLTYIIMQQSGCLYMSINPI